MPTKRIDVHIHFLPDYYREALVAAGHPKPDGMPKIPDWSEAEALKTMDRLEIATAMLSVSSPGVHFDDDQAARQLSRQLNDTAAQLVHRHPDRFGFFAVTPLPELLSSLLQVADKDHLHYGNDWPCTPADACEKLARQLEATPLLDPETRHAAMSENAVRLFPRLADTEAVR